MKLVTGDIEEDVDTVLGMMGNIGQTYISITQLL